MSYTNTIGSDCLASTLSVYPPPQQQSQIAEGNEDLPGLLHCNLQPLISTSNRFYLHWKHHAIEWVLRSDNKLHTLLISALHLRQPLVSGLGHFTRGLQWTWVWWGKNPVVQPVANHFLT